MSRMNLIESQHGGQGQPPPASAAQQHLTSTQSSQSNTNGHHHYHHPVPESSQHSSSNHHFQPVPQHSHHSYPPVMHHYASSESQPPPTSISHGHQPWLANGDVSNGHSYQSMSKQKSKPIPVHSYASAPISSQSSTSLPPHSPIFQPPANHAHPLPHGHMNGHQSSHIPPRSSHAAPVPQLPVKTEIYSEQSIVQSAKHIYREDESETREEEATDEESDDPNDTDYSDEMQVRAELGYRRSSRVQSRDHDRKPVVQQHTVMPGGAMGHGYENRQKRTTRAIPSYNEQDSSPGSSVRASRRTSSQRKRLHNSSESRDEDDEIEEALGYADAQGIATMTNRPVVKAEPLAPRRPSPNVKSEMNNRFQVPTISEPEFSSSTITNETIPYEMETLDAALRSTLEGNDNALNQRQVDTTYRALQDYSIALRTKCMQTTTRVRELTSVKQKLLERLERNELSPIQVLQSLKDTMAGPSNATKFRGTQSSPRNLGSSGSRSAGSMPFRSKMSGKDSTLDTPQSRLLRVQPIPFQGNEIVWKNHFKNPDQHGILWKELAGATKLEPTKLPETASAETSKTPPTSKSKKSDKNDPNKPPKDPCVCYCHNVPDGPVLGQPRPMMRSSRGLNPKSRRSGAPIHAHGAYAPPPPPPPGYPPSVPAVSPGPGYSGQYDQHGAYETSSQGSSVAPPSPNANRLGASPSSDRLTENGRPIPKRNKTKVTINRWTTPETERLKQIIGPLSPHDKVSLDRCREIAAELGCGRSHTQVLSRIQTLQRQSLRSFIRSQMMKTEGLIINAPACKSGYDGPKDPRRRRSGGPHKGPFPLAGDDARSGSLLSGISPKATSSTGGSTLDMDQTSNMSYQSESVMNQQPPHYDQMP